MSDSAKLRMTSRNEGTEPVVIAFMRGMVIVGAVAYAVKGNAAPDLIKLFGVRSFHLCVLGWMKSFPTFV